MKKYWFSLFLTLGLLFSLPSTFAMASALPDGVNQSPSIISQTSYTTEAQIVKDLRAAMVARQASITFECELPASSFDGTQESARALGERVLEKAMAHTGVSDEGDYIRLHLQEYSTNFGWESSGGKIHLTLTYSLTYYTTAGQEAQVKTAVDKAISGLSLESLSDHAKIRAIYTYLTENVDYDHDKLNDDSYLLKYSAYAAIINKTSVRQGYSNLLYRMLLTAGIDCRIITGISDDERHSWNIVEYNGKYYNLDATWDANIPPIGYRYFMKGTGDFESHWCDPEYETEVFRSAYPIPASGLSDADKIYKSGNYSYQVKNGYASIVSYTGNETKVTIPAVLGGYPVAEVAVHAFYENKTAKTITVSEGISYIDMS